MNQHEQVTPYLMNPAEDQILFGDELRAGMLAMPEETGIRARGGDEDAQLRGQRFRRIVRTREGAAASGGVPPQIVIICEWVDGYRETWSGAITHTWIVKREATAAEEIPR